jgi:hypothetical protein
VRSPSQCRPSRCPALTTLTLDELACGCGVSADWLHARLDGGLLACCNGEPRRFAIPQLQRLAIERTSAPTRRSRRCWRTSSTRFIG